MRQRALCLTVLLALCVTDRADALSLTFSFTNATNGGGTVEGVIRGLEYGVAGPASSVEVTSNTLGFGVGEYVGAPLSNSFQVNEDGSVILDFTSTGTLNARPAVRCCSLFLSGSTNRTQAAGLSDDPFNVKPNVGAITFTVLPDQPAPIPVPASLPLLLGAFAGLGWLGRRRGAGATRSRNGGFRRSTRSRSRQDGSRQRLTIG